MANIHSQKKRILRAERERLENRRYTSTIKTFFRRLEAAVAEGDDAADAEHRALVQTIDKAVKRGAMHRNTGARKKSRAARIRARQQRRAPSYAAASTPDSAAVRGRTRLRSRRGDARIAWCSSSSLARGSASSRSASASSARAAPRRRSPAPP